MLSLLTATTTAAQSAMNAINDTPNVTTGIFKIYDPENPILIGGFEGGIAASMLGNKLYLIDISVNALAPIQLDADKVTDFEQDDESITLYMAEGYSIYIMLYPA
jgi:hypothetical protein